MSPSKISQLFLLRSNSKMKNNIAQQNIPSGWQSTKVGTLGFAYNGLKSKSKTDFGHGKPYIPYMNIFAYSKINAKQFDYVEISENENQNAVKYGDVFFTVSSETPEEVGISSVLLDKIDDLYLNSFCFGFRLNNFNKLLPEYARFLFRGSDFRFQIIKMAQGSTRFNLSKDRVLSLTVLLPSLAEQQKIAEILGGVDEDIAKMQEVIEATEKLKRGLMQQLFTRGIGHTKFKKTKFGEIPEGWEVSRFGEIARITNGQVDPKKEPYKHMSLVAPNHVESDSGRIIYNETAEEQGAISGKYFVDKGDVIYSKIRPYLKKVTLAYEECLCSADMYPIKGMDGFDNVFLFYILLSDSFTDFANSNSARTGIPKINRDELNGYEFALPPLNEQLDIARILSAVDEKISVNKKLKEKLTLLKKGLMQDLLSGRVRTNI